MQMVLWTLAFLLSVGIFCYQLWGRFQVLLKVRATDGRNYGPATWMARLKVTFLYGFGQKKFFRDEQPSGLMHVVIFWGFLMLGLQVVTMFLRGWFPHFAIPGFEKGALLGSLYEGLKDLFQVGVLLAIGFAFYRWLGSKPKRLMGYLPAEQRLHQKKHVEALVILSFISGIMLSGFFYDATRMILLEESQSWPPITGLLSQVLAGIYGDHPEEAWTLNQVAWWVHNGIILIFLNLLPLSKHFHIITGIPNVFFSKLEPKGQLPKRDFTSETPFFGTSQPLQFTWKQVVDMYTCTECGRCSSHCPATATGKPLAPRQFLLNLRDHVYSLQSQIGKATQDTAFDTVVGEGKAVIDEVIWSCNACRACEEACPVNIEYVDKIMDIRQHLVQEAARFPSELNRTFKGLETQSNPWGISASERMAWAQGLDVPTIHEKPNVEYLYYVGCGGSFDAGGKKASQSFVKILKAANVSFAILGSDEACNGETARRLGNEYLYQTMAEALAAKINSFGIKKILVNCPHCFNTLKNEYPEFGGHWEVTAAAVFVKQLIADGKVPQEKPFEKRVVYHDSCYYGRFNNLFEQPREIVKNTPGTTLLEMDRSHHQSMCCGAGGGRMWMEEPKDQRVNILRTDQALEKRPDVIATSCPYCKIMLSSGVNEKGLSEKVQVMDVMEIVASNLP